MKNPRGRSAPGPWGLRAKLAAATMLLAGWGILAHAQTAPDDSSIAAPDPALADAPANPAPAAITPTPAPAKFTAAAPALVYVVPIQGEISAPQLYILRRALKEAIENHADAVVLDVDTLGGEMDTMLDMMDALSKFPGHTYTYVDDKAMSAGSFIATATNEIYFKPGATIGAAAAVTSEGTDIDSTMRLKLNSYIEAKVRALTTGMRYRADVQRAMMDEDFELKIGDKVIKPKGELLSLTGEEACQKYGAPPQPLLGAGLAPDVQGLLTQLYGAGNFTEQDFKLTWSEQLAKWINAIAPVLLGAGILLLLIEFKAPGMSLPGIVGISLLILVLAGQYVAGLAGFEPAILFALGIIFLLLELFVFTGSALCGVLGVVCFFAAFVWAMTDVWPGQSFGGVTAEALASPIRSVVIAMVLAGLGFALVLRFLPKTAFYGRLVNLQSVPADSEISSTGGAVATGANALPGDGTRGLAMTDLRPLGEIEIAGARFQARAAHGQINRGDAVEVTGRKDFALSVKKAS